MFVKLKDKNLFKR